MSISILRGLPRFLTIVSCLVFGIHATALGQAAIHVNISPEGSMTITGEGYPPNTTVNVTVENLNTGNSTIVQKPTDGNGNMTASSNPLGSITASPGDVIQVSTTNPNASDTAVVPERPSTGGSIWRAIGEFLGGLLGL